MSEKEFIEHDAHGRGGRLPVDPAASTDHLKPNGKRRSRRVNRGEQMVRHELSLDLRSLEIISKETPPAGDHLKIKIKPVMGIDND